MRLDVFIEVYPYARFQADGQKKCPKKAKKLQLLGFESGLLDVINSHCIVNLIKKRRLESDVF